MKSEKWASFWQQEQVYQYNSLVYVYVFCLIDDNNNDVSTTTKPKKPLVFC